MNFKNISLFFPPRNSSNCSKLWIGLAQILINLKLFLIDFFACIYFQSHMLMRSDSISRVGWKWREAPLDLLKVASNPKSQLADDLVLGSKNIANFHGIVSPSLESFKLFLVKHFGVVDYLETASWKTQGRRGSSSDRVPCPKTTPT